MWKSVQLTLVMYYNTYIIIIIIVTSSDDIQPSTLISDQLPSGLLLDMKFTGI